MKREVKVRSVNIFWPEQVMEIADTTGKKYRVPLDTTIHVTMVGFPDEEEKDLLARDLAPYMTRGYMIVKIAFEETNE